RKKDGATTITEPLLLLWKIGVLERLRPGVHAHVKASAVYCFADPFCKKRLQLTVVLTPKLAGKLVSAEDRCENRLDRKYPFREQLLADLAGISFSPSARPIIAERFSGKGFDNLRVVVTAIDCGRHTVRVSERGQITTSIASCPRE